MNNLSPSKLMAFLLILGILTSGLVGIGQFPLQDPDEGRYSDIASTMLRTGDWVTPKLNEMGYFSKPPLFFWMSALSMGVFGVNEGAARLPSVIASTLTALLVLVWGWREFSPRVGLLAGAVLGSIPLVAAFSRIVLVDPLLALLIALSFYCAYYALVRPAHDDPPNRWAILGFWVSIALGTLTKGPLAAAIPISAVGTYLVLTGSLRRLIPLLRLDGLFIALLIAAPWYVLMAVRNPTYLYDFFVQTNLARAVTGGEFRREGPLWYYIPVLAFGLFPWSLGFIGALRRAFVERRMATTQSRLRFFLFCSFAAPILLLSLSQSKIVYYILPLCPVLALLVAEFIVRFDVSESPSVDRWMRRLKFAAAFLGLVLLIGAAIFLLFPSRLLEWFQVKNLDSGASLFAAGLLGLAGFGALVSAHWCSRRRIVAASFSCAMTVLLMSCFVPSGAAQLGPLYSTSVMAQALDLHQQPNETLVSFGHFWRGITFYRQEPMILWETRFGEFGHRPQGALTLLEDPERLKSLWRERGGLLFLTERKRMGQIEAILEQSLDVVYESHRIVIARATVSTPQGS